METKPIKMSKYEPASLAKRVFAGIMDAAVMLFIFFLLAAWALTPIADVAMHRVNKVDQGYTYQFASHLFVLETKNEAGEYETVEVKDSNGKVRSYNISAIYRSENTAPSFYLKRIYYYYHNFKTNTDIEYPASKYTDYYKDCFYSPLYNEKIDGTLPKDLYTDAWFSKNVLEIESKNTYFKLDTSKENYLDSIVLKDETKKAEAVSFLQQKAYDAFNDCATSSYYVDLYNDIRWTDFFIYTVAFALSYSIFFITIPLIFKDGATLGKKTMKIAVISYDGYTAKKRQILFREFLLLLVMELLGVVFGIGLTSLAIMSAGVVVLFLLTLVSKVKRSPFDFAAYTIVVDSVHSTWFKNKAEEERHEKEVEDNLSKYRKYNPDESKLLQKGTEILDEELKKEVESKNNENK